MVSSAASDVYLREMKSHVADIIGGMDGKVAFHDFRMVHGPTHTHLIFDVVVPFGYPLSDGEVVSYIEKKIGELEGNYFAVIDVDKAYA